MLNNKLHQDGLGDKGLSVNAFAEKMGLSINHITHLCRQGKIFGARKHPLTKKWWIYPPAKLLCQPRSQKRVNTSNQTHFISQGAKQA
jgi:hypothetical protein